MDIDHDTLEKLRAVPITELLGMKPIYRRTSIRCPFHMERTPSCVIFPDNSYHCFGCRAHGANAIDFLIGLGATFKEATDELRKYI